MLVHPGCTHREQHPQNSHLREKSHLLEANTRMSYKPSLEWTATVVEGVTVINLYKLPPLRLLDDSIPRFNHPCMYAGDFNCHSTTWGYHSTNPDGISLENWASITGVKILFDPKQKDSIHSRRWNTFNPDLSFVNLARPSPHRTILEPFPRSQHRPSFILPVNPITGTNEVCEEVELEKEPDGRISPN